MRTTKWDMAVGYLEYVLESLLQCSRALLLCQMKEICTDVVNDSTIPLLVDTPLCSTVASFALPSNGCSWRLKLRSFYPHRY